MPEFETIRFEVEGPRVTITLNRPERINAFNGAMERDMRAAWTIVRDSDAIRVVVLTGAGDRGFCSGADRRAEDDERISQLLATNLWNREDVGAFLGPKSNRVYKPVITAVHGIACGGAFYMLGESDIIVASEDATFFDPHTTYGLTAVFEPILARQWLPYGEVMRMVLLGNDERISAQRALDLGFVTDVVTREQLLPTAYGLAERIAAKPPAAVQGSIYALWQSLSLPLGAAIQQGMPLTDIGNAAVRPEEVTATFGAGADRTFRVR